MADFSKLKVWSAAYELTVDIYRITRSFPREEVFGLTAQVRRASSSIAFNIAEESARGSDRDFARFIKIAIGSACEVETQLMLSRDLEMLSGRDCQLLLQRLRGLRRMLSGLLARISQ
jgi:four helix bundle protein